VVHCPGVSSLAGWVAVARADELRPGESKTVTAGPLRLALFNDRGRWFATDDACPHQGASLAAGTLHEGRVICPLHAWVFDLETGRCPHDSHDPVAVYRVRAVGETVEVELPVDDDAAGGDR